MAVSSNSIIHYTRELAAVQGIIREGFRIKYCSERITTRGGRKYERAFPMVCFCDLPLTHSQKHISSYGSYGIGLTKKWARKQGINPVQYVDYNSHVGNALRMALETGEAREHIEQIIMNTKNYDGSLIRNGNIIKRNYRFYDEREWRYLPSKKEIGGSPLILDLEDYEPNKDAYNSQLSDFRLEFELEDISYIILDQEDDVEPMMELMRERFESANIGSAYRKILTQEQIREDF